jgi:hypothetical protein
MAKTVVLEELPADTQRVLGDLLSSEEPVVLSRNGLPIGGMVSCATQQDLIGADQESEHKAAAAALEQGEKDYGAGNYLTLEQFREKYAERLQPDED